MRLAPASSPGLSVPVDLVALRLHLHVDGGRRRGLVRALAPGLLRDGRPLAQARPRRALEQVRKLLGALIHRHIATIYIQST